MGYTKEEIYKKYIRALPNHECLPDDVYRKKIEDLLKQYYKIENAV